MAIYLGRRLLGASSGLPESRQRIGANPRWYQGTICSLFDLASDGVCQANRVTPAAGELLPHRFTLTANPHRLVEVAAVCFLLHFP